MKKDSCLAVLMLLIGSSFLILPVSSQEQVSQTVYVYDGDFNGSLLSGVQVVGQDAGGNSFSGITDSNGVAVVSGKAGEWLFVFIKDGYETLDLNYSVNETTEGAVYLVKADPLTERVVPYLNSQQPEAVSKTNAAYQPQLADNANALVETEFDQDVEAKMQSPTEDDLMQTASSLDQVSQTVYVYDGDFNGSLLSGVQVVGQDAAGNGFSAITDSIGVAAVSGQAGIWQFGFIKDGYETLELSYNVSETGEGAVYLVRSKETKEQISAYADSQQPETIFKPDTTDERQLVTNGTLLGAAKADQEQEGQESTVSQDTGISELETTSTGFWLERGNFFYKQSRYDEAAKSYDRCILLNPQLEAAWLSKGNALYMQGDYDNALSAFDKAIEISPQDANAWICRGLTLKKLDRNLEANTAFMQAEVLGYKS